jgi:acyl carrier protein
MESVEFCQKLESLLEADPGTIHPETPLDRLEGWDSISVISFIAMADTEYHVTVPAKSIAACQTVGDLAGLVTMSMAG